MNKSRFTERQMVAIHKEAEIGAKVNATCRKYGISDATYYKWKSACAGMEFSQLRQLRDLQAENTRLKKMYAVRRWCTTPCRTLSAESSSPVAQSRVGTRHDERSWLV
jgi:putative transposase